MKVFRHHPYWQKACAIVALLSLLLQVQVVFACQIMDHGGPAKHCCCDTAKAIDTSPANDTVGIDIDSEQPASPCCEFGSQLTFKGADLESEDPATLQARASPEPSIAAFVFVLTRFWPIDPKLSLQPVVWEWDSDPGHPGTNTYLSTLRLRI